MSGPATPERILMVRTSALGDVVHALPVLTALRRSFPDAKIGWVVDETFAPLLDGHRLLDQVFAAPLRRARRSGERLGGIRSTAGFLRGIRRFRPDLALDLMGNHKGALIALASGAALRVGARRADRRERSSAMWINRTVAVDGSLHAVDRGLALVRSLGLETGAADFAPEALRCGEDRALESGLVLVHPGAAWGNKRYPPELWGEVAALLRPGSHAPIRIGAAPGEAGLADAVVASSHGAATRLDLPTLADLAGVIRGARLVLAGDTGPLHLARALGRPVLAIHGPTDPARHGPYGASESALAVRLACSFCHQRMDAAKACLAAISPAVVAARARTLL